MDSAGQRLLIAEDADGDRVGHVWFACKPETDKLYIYDIEVDDLGPRPRVRQAIDGADRWTRRERWACPASSSTCSPTTSVARHLYETSGYREMQRQMVKQLD